MQPREAAALRSFFRSPTSAGDRLSWLQTYSRLDSLGTTFIDLDPLAVDWDFDALAAWTQAFHILSAMHNPVAELELLQRLQRSGAEFSSTKAVSGSLKACNCPVYLHYAWCEHACAKAVLDGVIRLPRVSSNARIRAEDRDATKRKRKDATATAAGRSPKKPAGKSVPVDSSSPVGRPAMAVRGGALGTK